MTASPQPQLKAFRLPVFRPPPDFSGGAADEPSYHVGSSDIGTILGFGWEAPADRWARIMGFVPRYSREEKNRDTQRGRIFEAAIIGEWVRRHRPARVLAGPTLDDRPFRAADGWRTSRPDALAWLETGECVSIEAKAPREFGWDEEADDGWGPPGTDWVPRDYRCQGLWQLGVGHDEAVGHNPVRVDIVAYSSDGEYREYTIPMGPAVEWVRARATAWMQRYVWCDLPHPPGMPSAATLLERYRDGGQSVHKLARQWLPADPESLEIAQRLARVNATINTLVERKDLLERHLKARIGDAYGIEGVASWPPTRGRVELDVERLATERPDIFRAFMRRGAPSRTFRLNYRPPKVRPASASSQGETA